MFRLIFHVCVAFRFGVGNHSSLDQTVLHLLQFIGTSTGVFIVHVSHAFKRGKLQSVRVSEWSSSRSKCSIVSDLNVFDVTIQDSDVMAGSAELFVERSEGCKHLVVADNFHGEAVRMVRIRKKCTRKRSEDNLIVHGLPLAFIGRLSVQA